MELKNLLTLKIPGPGGSGSQEIPAPSGIPTGGLSGDGGKIIGFGLAVFLFVCVLLSLGFIVWGGLNWLWSQGDKTKIENARRTIVFAIFGLVICILSFVVISFLGQVLKVDFFNFSLSQ